MSYSEAFRALKARYCIAAIIVAWYWQPGNQTLAQRLPDSGWYWPELLFHYYGHALIALFLVAAAMSTGLRARYLLGRAPRRRDIPSILFIVVLTFCASLALVSLTVVPVSYILPEFVAWWLTWYFQPTVYVSWGGNFPMAANVLSFVSLVVIAPALEELLFRGYLLHRWSMKWGLRTGALLSSALFGAVHPDTLGATVTGFGFAALYLKTQTLWAPIAAHAAYNLVVWLWDFYGVTTDGLDYYQYTIDQFRADWWMGAVGLGITVFMVDRIVRRNKPLGPFRLPVADGSNS